MTTYVLSFDFPYVVFTCFNSKITGHNSTYITKTLKNGLTASFTTEADMKSLLLLLLFASFS